MDFLEGGAEKHDAVSVGAGSGCGPGSAVQPEAPLYLQIAATLKEEILCGTYPFGSRLPVEDQLCERFSVSRYTIREALRRLREERLISSRRGARTLIMPSAPTASYVIEPISRGEAAAFASGMYLVVDSMNLIALGTELASRIGVSPDEEWLAVRGFRYTDGEEFPKCWSTNYINPEFADVGKLLHRHKAPIHHLIEDLFSVRISEINQEIGASLIPNSLADKFKVKPQSAGVEIRRLYRVSEKKVAQLYVGVHPASRFVYRLTLRRTSA